MTFRELYEKIHGKTDIDIVKDGHILLKIKYDWDLKSIPIEIRQAEVDYIQAVDYRTIEIRVG